MIIHLIQQSGLLSVQQVNDCFKYRESLKWNLYNSTELSIVKFRKAFQDIKGF
jgi:hypothetical protein